VENKLCVLIDFENIAAGTEKEGLGRFDIKAVLRRLKDKGRILVSRSYGDWGRFAKYKQRLLEQGVTMVELTSYRGAEKNRADIALVVDAMEIAYTRPYLDTFVLLSGDSDFTPLVMRLKELDKRVIGIGTRRSTSRLLSESCDEFIFYESLRRPLSEGRGERQDRENRESRESREGREARIARQERQDREEDERKPSDLATRAMPREEAFTLLSETVQGLLKDDPGSMLAGLVKQSMQRKEPTFDETEYGYSGFARFLEAARDKNLVSLTRDPRAGGYRVDLPGNAPPDAGSANAPANGRRGAAPDRAAPDDAEDESEALIEGRAGELQAALATAGPHPLNHFIRHTVIHEFVDHVSERQNRNKRNTLMYVYGDIARRCRKTDPFVPPRFVKHVINGLKAAGELLHASGGPIRSQSAHFTIGKDSEELLDALRKHHVRTLLELGEDLSDGEALSNLLWGDDAHVGPAEETVAWCQNAIKEDAEARAAADAERDEPTDEADATPADAAPADAAPEEAAAEEAPADDVSEEDDAPAEAAEEAPVAAEEAPVTDAEEAPVAAEEAPVTDADEPAEDAPAEE
jgi:uncharacterized protein (TIGR00288 family)